MPQETSQFRVYIRPLDIADLDAVDALEKAAFEDPEERATRDKLAYRLTKAYGLSMGIFGHLEPVSSFEDWDETAPGTAAPHANDKHREMLLGHVVSAKTMDKVASDRAMTLPDDWASTHPVRPELGHAPEGRTLVLHSIAVKPAFQGQGLGTKLVSAYVERMSQASIASRMALVAHEHKIKWYSKLGFINCGPSQAKFAGGGWYDMVLNLDTDDHSGLAR